MSIFMRDSARLSDQQTVFVHGFVSGRARRTRLVAETGTGKTTAALHAVRACLIQEFFDSVLVLAHNLALVELWRGSLRSFDVDVAASLDEFVASAVPSFAVSSTALFRNAQLVELLKTSKSKRYLVVVDEGHDASKQTIDFVETILQANSASRSLTLFTSLGRISKDRWDEPVDAEYFFGRRVIEFHPTQIEIARFAPTHEILRTLLSRQSQLDGLSWRQFERLVAELLESDGYKVELMQGSKDGGVDVVATKSHDAIGELKTLWQAKKKLKGGKVGLSVVRELADTRNEFGASKALIVTSTYLTRDAIKRIERDRYLLGKVDRGDLDAWIARVLYQRHGA